MHISTDRDVRFSPVPQDLANEVPDVPGGRGTRWRLSGAQQHRDGSRRHGFVDVDRQEAALAVMIIPKRQLLVAMYDVAGVIDI
jgi:hypothetical protein